MTVEEFEEFYLQTVGRLVGQLFVIIGDFQEAQDVVQEAFARGWARRRQLDNDRSPEAWIRTVAARLAISRWRGARRSMAAWHKFGADSPQTSPGPETVSLVAELRKLSARQRHVIALHYVCDMSIAQIAAETGMAAGTVKTHLIRGRAALADQLAEPSSEESADE